MSHALTPVATLDAVTVPDPGDARTAASVGAPFQNCANRDAWIIAHGDGGATLSAAFYLPISSAVRDPLVSGSWIHTTGIWLQDDITGQSALYMDLRLPHNTTLQSVHAKINGKHTAGHSALPVNKPFMAVQQINPDTGAVLATFSAADPSASLVAYDAPHSIDVNGINTTVNNAASTWRIRIIGESGTNSVANTLAWYGLLVDWAPV